MFDHLDVDAPIRLGGRLYRVAGAEALELSTSAPVSSVWDGQQHWIPLRDFEALNVRASRLEDGRRRHLRRIERLDRSVSAWASAAENDSKRIEGLERQLSAGRLEVDRVNGERERLARMIEALEREKLELGAAVRNGEECARRWLTERNQAEAARLKAERGFVDQCEHARKFMDERDAWQQRADKLAEQRDSHQAARDRWQVRATGAEAEASTWRARADDAAGTVKALSEERTKLAGDLAALRYQADSLHARAIAAEARADQRIDYFEWRAKRDGAPDLAAVTMERDQLRGHLETERAAAKMAIGSLTAERDGLRVSLDESEHLDPALWRRLARERLARVEALEAELAGVKADCSKAEAEFERVGRERDAERDKSRSLAGLNRELADRVALLEAERAQAVAALGALRLEHHKLAARAIPERNGVPGPIDTRNMSGQGESYQAAVPSNLTFGDGKVGGPGRLERRGPGRVSNPAGWSLLEAARYPDGPPHYVITGPGGAIKGYVGGTRAEAFDTLLGEAEALSQPVETEQGAERGLVKDRRANEVPGFLGRRRGSEIGGRRKSSAGRRVSQRGDRRGPDRKPLPVGWLLEDLGDKWGVAHVGCGRARFLKSEHTRRQAFDRLLELSSYPCASGR